MTPQNLYDQLQDKLSEYNRFRLLFDVEVMRACGITSANKPEGGIAYYPDYFDPYKISLFRPERRVELYHMQHNFALVSNFQEELRKLGFEQLVITYYSVRFLTDGKRVINLLTGEDVYDSTRRGPAYEQRKVDVEQRNSNDTMGSQ